MTSEESPLADSTTPRKVPGKASEKKKSAKIIKAPKPPPKTTQRGEIVRKAAEDRFLQEKVSLSRQLEERKAKYEAYMEKKKCKVPDPNNEESKVKKPIKKTVPDWATCAHTTQKLPEHAKPRALDIIIEAFTSEENEKATLSGMYIKDYFKSHFENNCKHLFAKGIKTALNKGYIKQAKGVGISGSFKLAKRPTSSSISINTNGQGRPSLDCLMPHIFTWVCEPKEASAGMIKKYLNKFYKDLTFDGKSFKKALEHGVLKGQLERLTGKGACGTFSLVDGANKTGARFEDAIEDAIIAMNEPKDASVSALKHYLSEFHTEYGITKRPYILKNCLERLLQKGHIMRVSGKGFSGTFRLSYPYYPSPRDIWREEYESDSEDNKAESPKKKKTSKTSTVKSSSKKEWLSNGLKNKKKLGSSTPTTSNSSKKKSVNKKKLSKSPRKNGMAPLPPKKAMTKRVSKKSST
nr:heterochromatin protein 1-binding protein 3-like [Lepeophtheirus salmonis]